MQSVLSHHDLMDENRVLTKSTKMFICAYILYYSFSLFFWNSTFNFFLEIPSETWQIVFSIPTFVLLVCKVLFFQKYTGIQLLMVSILTIVFFVGYYFSGAYRILIGLLFVIAAKDIDVLNVAKIAMKTIAFMIILIAIFSLVGITNNTISVRDGAVRFTLGFRHPNNLGDQVFQFFACWIFTRWHKIRWFDYLWVFSLALLFYFFCNSRTSFYLTIFLLVCAFAFKSVAKNNTLILLVKVIIVLCPIISIFLTVFYDRSNSILLGFDSLFSGRLQLAHEHYLFAGFSLYGQKDTIKTLGFALDNAYVYNAIVFGMVSLFFILTAIYLCIIKAEKENYTPAIIIITAYCLYSLFELVLFSPTSNILLLLLLSYVLYSSKRSSLNSSSEYKSQ